MDKSVSKYDLTLVKSENFGSVQCDFWQNEQGDILMTREQIGRALEYADPDKAIANIHDRNRDRLDKFSTTLNLRKVEGNRVVSRDVTVYTAKGIYEICRFSRQPKADAFMDWVWDVIETIRKHGMYVTDKLLDNPDFAIKVFQQLKKEREMKAKLLEQIEQDKPYTNFGKAISTSDDGILIGDFAKLLKNDGIVIGQNRLFAWLRDNGYLIKEGRRKNRPVQKYLEMGLFQVKESVVHTSQGDKVTITPLITGKGQLYFIEKLREEYGVEVAVSC